MSKLILFLLLTISVMAHTPRNIQAPNVAADFWTQWGSTNPRMALFVKLTPKADWTGVSAIGFTSNTRNMTLPGHPGVTFYSSPGITPTIVEQGLGDVANLELTGVYQTGIFERLDVIAGQWSFSEIEVFSACWNNTDLGELVHFRGNLGEFRDYGTYFTAEGRGLIGRLSNDVVVATQRMCRVKEFGNTRCKKVLTGSFTYNATSDVAGAVITETAHGMTTGETVYLTISAGAINPELTVNTGYFVIRATADTFKLATTYANAVAGTGITLTAAAGTITVNRGAVIIGSVVYKIKQSSVTGIGSASGSDTENQVMIFDTSTFAGVVPTSPNFVAWLAYFPNGTLTAVDGPNAGITREIATASEATGLHPYARIELKRPFPFAVDTNTLFDLTMGCKRRLEDCRAYHNAVNFDAEAFVPGIEAANRITSGF
ncbi:MAG: DUF2163 domain-containing protein [Acidobacteria bacterium]|nr:DUF2163 domain-containing protein [Acidobacteriota bacterium]